MSYETLKIDRKDKGIVWVTIDNPPANALSDNLMSDFERLVEELSTDKTARVVVLASANEKIFVAGADLKGMIAGGSKVAGNDSAISDQSGNMQKCFDKFATMPIPVIASINGHALGGGCELALACDFRIMAQGKGKIGLTEVSLGLIPGAGGTQRMTRLLGRAKATELIFFSKRLNAEEALEVGLVNKVTTPESLEEETLAFAEELAEGAVRAMGLAKEAMNAAEEGTIEEGMKVEAEAFAKTFKTGEPGVGLAAFFQRKKANFLPKK